jgi:hypothetical protein
VNVQRTFDQGSSVSLCTSALPDSRAAAPGVAKNKR